MIPAVSELEQNGHRFMLYESDRLAFQGELRGQNLYLHVRPIENWGKEVYYECMNAMTIIRDAARQHGYKDLWVFFKEDPKIVKFFGILDFDIKQSFSDISGDIYILMGQVI